MITKKQFQFVAATALLAYASVAWSKSQTITISAASVSSQAAEDRGSVHVFAVEIPEDVVGKRLDTVLLEFQVDVGLAEDELAEMAPVVGVYPLTEQLSLERSPVFTSTFASSRNVRAEDGQTILVDITEIVRGWLDEPSSNHGLVVGSFGGAKLAKLELSTDAIAPGKVARVTFFYQNRFGDRLSVRQE